LIGRAITIGHSHRVPTAKKRKIQHKKKYPLHLARPFSPLCGLLIIFDPDQTSSVV
jgi:hypothetical protein